jgi:hypothetical protein
MSTCSSITSSERPSPDRVDHEGTRRARGRAASERDPRGAPEANCTHDTVTSSRVRLQLALETVAVQHTVVALETPVPTPRRSASCIHGYTFAGIRDPGQ